jgi:hypothetical protein
MIFIIKRENFEKIAFDKNAFLVNYLNTDKHLSQNLKISYKEGKPNLEIDIKAEKVRSEIGEKTFDFAKNFLAYYFNLENYIGLSSTKTYEKDSIYIESYYGYEILFSRKVFGPLKYNFIISVVNLYNSTLFSSSKILSIEINGARNVNLHKELFDHYWSLIWKKAYSHKNKGGKQ